MKTTVLRGNECALGAAVEDDRAFEDRAGFRFASEPAAVVPPLAFTGSSVFQSLMLALLLLLMGTFLMITGTRRRKTS